ncbi:MAG: hypothetical protein HYV14_02495 [Elusimicrobia bacterium]|nr:hypothetical protein [Elusimicrobiota bacterium]
MRTKGRRWLGALALSLGLAGTAWADASDSLTVTIVPGAAYAVDIDTALVVLNLGTVNLSGSTFTVSPATVQVNSSYAATDLTIAASVLSGGWTLDANTATNENDALKAWAVFSDTSVTNAATLAGLSGAFTGTVPGATGSDVLGTASAGVGTEGSGDVQYVLLAANAGYKTMDALPTFTVDGPASRAHLWLKFTLPPTTTDLTAKLVQITVTGGGPN